MTHPRLRFRFAASVLGIAVLLAGCSTGTVMMSVPAGGNSGFTDGMSGGGMMGGTGAVMNGYTLSGTSCTPPAGRPGAAVTVLLGDMGMTSMMSGTAPMGAPMMLRATPATVPAGTVTLLATNRGWRTHELVLLPLAAGATVGQRVPDAAGKVPETGSVAEASSACGAGVGEGIPSGSASWVTVTLTAGRYELVCNVANHYADGMHTELDVT